MTVKKNEIDYQDKNIIECNNKIEDNRGYIQSISDLDMKSASIIYTKKNHWRANHYHKKDWHFIYVAKGSFEYYFRKTNSNENIQKKIVNRGQVLFTGSMVDHAMFYTEETEILVVSKNPRDQKTYEEDTVIIDFMDDEKRF